MRRQVEFTISWTAIAKLLLAILMAYLLVRLWTTSNWRADV
jgi:hypothetical protein